MGKTGDMAGLSSRLFETERYVLTETLRDIADELAHGERSQRLVLITPQGPNGRPLYRIVGRGETRGR
jgi:hypothetical protein